MILSHNRKIPAILLVCAVCVGLVSPRNALFASDWRDVGVDIASVELAAAVPTFDASGLVYHTGLNVLLGVGDDGDIVQMSTDGSGVSDWSVAGDPEDIAIADMTSEVIYIADENAGTVSAFDLVSGGVTGDTWNVSGYITTASRQGIEAMTFVPNGFHPYADSTSGGLFYVGSQYNGDIAVLDIDTSVSGSLAFIDTIETGRSDLAGLHWNSDTQLIYAVYDGSDVLTEYAADGTAGVSYDMPTGVAQEGVALVADCASGTGTLFIADDGGPYIWQYSGYPIETEIVFEDGDGDGLGNPASTALVCVDGSSAGYVSNSDDTNDAIPNAGIEISGDGIDNDGDAEIDEYNTVAENGAHPYYSTLSASDLSAYGTTITSFAVQQKGGLLLVTYSDNSIYAYSIWSGGWRMRPLMSGSSVMNSAYILISYDGFSWSIYDGYTGAFMASTRGFKTKAAASNWAVTTLGL
jgi:hypothetical protein